MTAIDAVTLEVTDPVGATRFYADAFGLDSQLNLRAATEPSEGFRGFTLSLTVAQPADVNLLTDAAAEAGATVLKAAEKSMWGYGAVLRAPDGTIWKVATSAKKDSGPATRDVESIVLLLGCADVGAAKRFYVEHGLPVARSFGRMYVEFETGSGAITLGLYRRRALAKVAGVDQEGSGSHRIAIAGTGAPFTDLDGFAWETSTLAARP